jgi:fumarate hydratase class II
MTMVCVQVFGNDAAITFAGSQGQFQLNVFKPVIIYNMVESTKLLSDACKSFAKHLVEGLQPNKKMLQRYVENSLMLVTALTPVLGYDKAAMVAKKALLEEITLKEAAKQLGYLTEKEFENLVDIRGMAG